MSGTTFYSPLDATERILANGRPLAPREFVELSEEEQKDPHNARLIAEGKLIQEVIVEQTLEQLRATAGELEVPGRSDMTKAQLKKAINDKMAKDAEQATADAAAEEANQ